MIKTMVILNEELEAKQMFQFESSKIFKTGETITHEKLDGEFEVKFVDIATVQVLKI